jgi:PAS domain S-box-containing protein
MTHKHPLYGNEREGEAGTMHTRKKATQREIHANEAHVQAALLRAEANYAQLERTQSQLRAIIDASPDAMLFLTADGRPIKVNTRFTDFFGLDDAIVLSQLPDQLMALLKELFETSDSLERSLVWSTVDQKEVIREQLMQVEPSRREFDLSSLPVTNADQTYIGRLYIWHDITHEREVERMKSELASMVTHELRSPLTAISGYVDLLLNEETLGSLTKKQRESLFIVLDEAHRMLSLTNDLLDLSHLESGTIEWCQEPLNLNHLIQELIPPFRLRWEAMRQTFTLHLPEQAIIVLGDADRVRQILTNLLSNAHKYTPEEGHIDLSVEAIGSVACVAVTDTGIGLSTEEQTRLFTRFYRVRNAVTKAVSGTGLGLAITRMLVEMQGGKIQVSSEPGHGSTFRFTLPLAEYSLPDTFSLTRNKTTPKNCRR